MMWGEESGSAFVPRQLRFASREPQIYGTSTKGAPLEVYLPSMWDGDSSEKKLVIAGIHGEEPETTNLLSYVFRSIDPRHLRWAVILCANPDGMARGARGNSNGVDLNRNFGSSNWIPDPVHTRWEMNLPQDVELSPGSAPFSEPESKYLAKFAKEQEVSEIINIHAPMGCVDYGQRYDWKLPHQLSGALSLPLVSDIGYPCPGSMGSWADEQPGLKYLTLELEDTISISQIRTKYGPVLQEILLS